MNQRRYDMAVTEAARRFQLRKQNWTGARVPKGCLQVIIDEVKKEMKVEREIKCETVRSRVKRNNLTGYSASRDSPIAEIESYIAQTIIQMSRINKALSISGCFQLAISMISGTAYFDKLVQFKRSRGIKELILREWS